jgi:hypothetical protein
MLLYHVICILSFNILANIMLDLNAWRASTPQSSHDETRDHIFIILFIVLTFRATTNVSKEVVDRFLVAYLKLFDRLYFSILKLVNAISRKTKADDTNILISHA